ncbi:DNA-(apurinic or apyrimidinic site) lyase [Saprospiraceae bacterium]|nr:DNA-(apurinic or apyrimidinic site) lyase [bacterium]MDB4539362.1 DNA-(apurinic or apyrimidinic site) lyase [Saprospiraceae bacterium]MDG1434219.1 DNA-formamidopyrimidine glycosylase family protein [Saprospiraceae bacterium]
MPELPEVNSFKLYFDKTTLNQKIREVEVQDDKIMRNINGDDFIEKLTGRTFVNSYRRGKYLFGKLDDGNDVLFHFGMTGDIKYYEDDMDQPRHERFAFHFTNGYRLGFDCPRKFARILYLKDLEKYISEIGLGEDALIISENSFLEKLEGRKTSIKGFLLNQKLLAGVGNLYADEICFQTRIHPGSSISALRQKQKKDIYKVMQNILSIAVNRARNYKEEKTEDDFFQWRVKGQKAPKGKGVCKVEKIAGRTTYYFDIYQRLYQSK